MALANAFNELDTNEELDVVVIGSGYGAGVCAARLAQAGKKVCVLERGREFSASGGDETRFPEEPDEIRDNVQIDGWPFKREHRLGLYNFHINRDLDVLVGCGLGGTSLINANVAIRPDPRVFQQAMWPEEIRTADAPFDDYFDLAESVLDPSPYPGNPRATPRALATMEANGANRCRLNVHFEGTENSIGVPQTPCNDCGNCVTGCNYEAKKTLCFTYLPIAKSHGAKIFVQCDVDYISRRSDGKWEIHFQHVERGDEAVSASSTVVAKTVVVGAGVMGTLGILLRSRDRGLSLSTCLGTRVSGNGDALALAYNCDQPVDSVGGIPVFDLATPTGPTIKAVIDCRDYKAPLEKSIIIEDGAFPYGLASFLRPGLQIAAGYSGAETAHGFQHWFHERVDEANDLFGKHEEGALNRTLMFLLMGHDGADGRIESDDQGRATIRWPELHNRTTFASENALARVIAARLGGIFVTDPLDTPLLQNNLITVHPLGGCPMGDSIDTGVVDHTGAVFGQPGLYVADASVIPTSLGVNPLLTITAVAERIAHKITGCAKPASTLKQGATITP
jgi:cholesterol oxidase